MVATGAPFVADLAFVVGGFVVCTTESACWLLAGAAGEVVAKFLTVGALLVLSVDHELFNFEELHVHPQAFVYTHFC